mmetsp:Transcript_53484/g.154244  ORF Transcript_53484/g.154244 Transcript_53484/m.154244 type:complete len:322 (-) Transcript_53484:225-1190(-)
MDGPRDHCPCSGGLLSAYVVASAAGWRRYLVVLRYALDGVLAARRLPQPCTIACWRDIGGAFFWLTRPSVAIAGHLPPGSGRFRRAWVRRVGDEPTPLGSHHICADLALDHHLRRGVRPLLLGPGRGESRQGFVFGFALQRSHLVLGLRHGLCLPVVDRDGGRFLLRCGRRSGVGACRPYLEFDAGGSSEGLRRCREVLAGVVCDLGDFGTFVGRGLIGDGSSERGHAGAHTGLARHLRNPLRASARSDGLREVRTRSSTHQRHQLRPGHRSHKAGHGGLCHKQRCRLLRLRHQAHDCHGHQDDVRLVHRHCRNLDESRLG